MREIINRKLTSLELSEDTATKLADDVKSLDIHIADLEKAQAIMQKAAQLSQEHLAIHLSSIVTEAIQAVIEKPYEFVCRFVERRGSTEADLYLTKDGEEFDILGGTGGGLADVCSFALKIAYLLLSNVDKVLIIDEVSRHVNSPQQRENFAKVLYKLSQEFCVQMIINTTIPELLDVADQVFEFSYVNGETVVK